MQMFAQCYSLRWVFVHEAFQHEEEITWRQTEERFAIVCVVCEYIMCFCKKDEYWNHIFYIFCLFVTLIRISNEQCLSFLTHNAANSSEYLLSSLKCGLKRKEVDMDLLTTQDQSSYNSSLHPLTQNIEPDLNTTHKNHTQVFNKHKNWWVLKKNTQRNFIFLIRDIFSFKRWDAA